MALPRGFSSSAFSLLSTEKLPSPFLSVCPATLSAPPRRSRRELRAPSRLQRRRPMCGRSCSQPGGERLPALGPGGLPRGRPRCPCPQTTALQGRSTLCRPFPLSSECGSPFPSCPQVQQNLGASPCPPARRGPPSPEGCPSGSSPVSERLVNGPGRVTADLPACGRLWPALWDSTLNQTTVSSAHPPWSR